MESRTPLGERLAVWFEAPRQVRVRAEPVPRLRSGEVLVRTRVSAISVGTELAAYRGRLDPGMARDDTLPALREGGFRFPFRYGYASVGTVEDRAEDVPRDAPPSGRRVFAFVPHQSVFPIAAESLEPVPDGVPDERAALFPYLETAVNLALDGAPRVGDRVVVVGQGVLGLTLTGLLARFPLGSLVSVEPRPGRRQRSRELGARRSFAPEVAAAAVRRVLPQGADLVFEVSGAGAALDAAIGFAAREGRVIAGSWLAGGATELDLGGWFHRGRIRIVSSQVSRLPPLGPAWSVRRRRETAWSLLRTIPLETLVTDRFPLARAAEAYRRLDAGIGLASLLVSRG